MGSTMELKYRDGRLTDILMRDPLAVSAQDLRAGDPSFVSINAHDGEFSSKLFLEPEVAEALTKSLVKLFPTAGPRPTFSLALGQIADYLATEKEGGISDAEDLAVAVLKRACLLAKQDEEHDKLSF